MIGKLRGVVDTIEEDAVLLDVNQVGYEVFISSSHASRLNIGDRVELIIETHVREDHLHLYGFENAEARAWFRILTKVSGVGVKLALGILGVLPPNALIQALAEKNRQAFLQVSGVGPKLAERIVTELKDKAALYSPALSYAQPSSPPSSAVVNDAVTALIQLGYRRPEALQAASTVITASPQADVGEVIRKSLKELARL